MSLVQTLEPEERAALSLEVILLNKPWLCLVVAFESERANRECREFACLCARSVLPFYEERYPEDLRPRNALVAAEQYLLGNLGEAELAIAEREAFEAAREASKGLYRMIIHYTPEEKAALKAARAQAQNTHQYLASYQQICQPALERARAEQKARGTVRDAAMSAARAAGAAAMSLARGAARDASYNARCAYGDPKSEARQLATAGHRGELERRCRQVEL